MAPAHRAPPVLFLFPSAASPARETRLRPEAEQKAAAAPAAWRAISPARAWAPAAAAAAAASRAPTCRSPGVRAPAGGVRGREERASHGWGRREEPVHPRRGGEAAKRLPRARGSSPPAPGRLVRSAPPALPPLQSPGSLSETRGAGGALHSAGSVRSGGQRQLRVSARGTGSKYPSNPPPRSPEKNGVQRNGVRKYAGSQPELVPACPAFLWE